MDGRISKRTALAACQFCDRDLCEDQTRFHPCVLPLYTSHNKEVVKAWVGEDALRHV